jgi:hypothetical protein
MLSLAEGWQGSQPCPTPSPSPETYATCTCPSDTQPDAVKVYKKDSKCNEFSWISDADQEQGGGWCYFRGFKNLSTKNTVTVDFPEANMSAEIVTPTGELINRVENHPAYEDPVRSFDLYYGPLKTTKISAALFRPQVQSAALDTSDLVQTGVVTSSSQSRTDTSRPIISEIRYDVRDPQTKKDYKVMVTLSSSVATKDKVQQYSFSIMNQGEDALRFEWQALGKTYDSTFMEILIAYFQRNRSDGPGIELKAGEKFEIKPVSGRSPEIILGVMNIYRDQTLLAKGFAPAFIPSAR